MALLAKHRATRLDSTFLHAISTSRKVALGATGGTKRKLPVTLEDASDYDDNERANTSGDGSDSRETPARTASQPKKRIPTHVLRKVPSSLECCFRTNQSALTTTCTP